MTARLVFVSGRKAGASIELEAERSTIGRNPKSDVRFPPDEVLVSSDHAYIERRGDEYVLIDAGSRNGTFVNEEPVGGEVTLGEGDVIRFGSRGPSVEFTTSSTEFIAPTLDASDKSSAAGLFREARKRASSRHPGEVTLARRFSTTREFAALAIQRSSRRAKATTVMLGSVMLAAVIGLSVWQERSRARLQSTLDEIAIQLQAERGMRNMLEENLQTIRSNYDSMLGEVESTRRQLDETRRSSSGIPESVTRSYSQGVALLVFSYGFTKRNSDVLLRFQLDRNGQPIMERAPDGQAFPRIGFGGEGPPLARHGSATGFLVDSAGWIVTNRHVAQPWEQETDLEFLRGNGLDVEPTFIVLQAYFPPGGSPHDLTVHGASGEVDLAVLRTTNRSSLGIPVIPLGDPQSNAAPGEQIVFIGYPTGVHNLLFRIPESDRTAILESIGQDPVPLARELASRDLIQPLVIGGSVSDTTRTEIIHTAGTTGGGSGGPLIGVDHTVVGIHYAAVRSPIAGDPFQTQRAVKVGFIWDVLPGGLRGR